MRANYRWAPNAAPWRLPSSDQTDGWVGAPCLPRGTWTFTAVDDGYATRVDEHFAAEIRGPLRLLTPLLRHHFGPEVGYGDVHAAERILEGA